MKRLLLLRHAKAVPATEPLADSARPLARSPLLMMVRTASSVAWSSSVILLPRGSLLH